MGTDGAPPATDQAGRGPTPPGLARLARGTFVYGLGSVLNRLVTFALLPILTRFLTTGEYGVSAILDVACALLVALFSLGAGSALTICYFESRDRDSRERSVSTTFVMLLASVSLLLLLAVTGPGALARYTVGDPGRADLILLCAATAAAMILQQPFSMRLQFEERASRLVTLNLVSTVLLVAFSLLGVVVLGRGVRGLWEGRLLAHLVTLLLFASHFPLRKLLRFRGATAGELVRLGLPMVPSFAAIFVLLQGNRYILSLFEEMSVVGVYSVGVQLGMVMGLAVSAFSTAWTPYYMSYNDRRDQAPGAFSRATTYYVLGFGGLSLFFYLGARPALMLLTAPAFHDAYRVAGYAATAQLLIGAFNLLMPPCTFAREIKFASLIQGLAALLAVVANLVLIPRFGMGGAGVALFLGPLAMAALLWAWNRRSAGRYIRITYAWRRLTLFSGLYLLVATLATRPRSWTLGPEIGLALVGSLTIAGLVWLLLSRDERGGVTGQLAALAPRVPLLGKGRS